jgi:hypothetical protein
MSIFQNWVPREAGNHSAWRSGTVDLLKASRCVVGFLLRNKPILQSLEGAQNVTVALLSAFQIFGESSFQDTAVFDSLRRWRFKTCTVISSALAIVLGFFVLMGIVASGVGAVQADLERSPPDAMMAASMNLMAAAVISLFVGLPTAILAHRFRRTLVIIHLLIPVGCIWLMLMLGL